MPHRHNTEVFLCSLQGWRKSRSYKVVLESKRKLFVTFYFSEEIKQQKPWKSFKMWDDVWHYYFFFFLQIEAQYLCLCKVCGYLHFFFLDCSSSCQDMLSHSYKLCKNTFVLGSQFVLEKLVSPSVLRCTGLFQHIFFHYFVLEEFLHWFNVVVVFFFSVWWNPSKSKEEILICSINQQT